MMYVLCLSGAAMFLIALFSSNVEKGNVIPGLVIALLGVTANTWFWLRYRKLNHENPDVILAAQSKLYLAKSLMDACVMIALMFLVVAPDAPIMRHVDFGGSVVVSVYIIVNGAVSMRHPI